MQVTHSYPYTSPLTTTPLPASWSSAWEDLLVVKEQLDEAESEQGRDHAGGQREALFAATVWSPSV